MGHTNQDLRKAKDYIKHESLNVNTLLNEMKKKKDLEPCCVMCKRQTTLFENFYHWAPGGQGFVIEIVPFCEPCLNKWRQDKRMPCFICDKWFDEDVGHRFVKPERAVTLRPVIVGDYSYSVPICRECFREKFDKIYSNLDGEDSEIKVSRR